MLIKKFDVLKAGIPEIEKQIKKFNHLSIFLVITYFILFIMAIGTYFLLGLIGLPMILLFLGILYAIAALSSGNYTEQLKQMIYLKNHFEVK